MPQPSIEIPIRDDVIRLGQLLKLANMVEDGSDVKELLADEAVDVNGELETRRGRQLLPGDLICVDTPRGVVTLQVVREA